MEVLLQWLDEVDDIVSVALLCWPRARFVCLLAGLTAAILLYGERLGFESAVPALLLVNISVACVVVWSMMTLLNLALDRKIAAAT